LHTFRSALLRKGYDECNAMEEVTTMESYTMTRPSMSLSLACAPSAPAPGLIAARIWAPVAADVAVMAAERAPVSRVHQVQVQAELAQVLTRIDETTSITGFKGINVSKKLYADGGSGVPPRGRPV
jgi:hypothetical protein